MTSTSSLPTISIPPSGQQMAPPAAPPSTAPSRPPLNPSASPLPLSASQEAQVREIYHKRVRNYCADEVRDFAACATHRTFTATIFCRPQQRAMNTCMMRYATRAEQDAAREEWFATMEQRREERVKKEAKRAQDEIFWREWWDKDLKKVPSKEGGGKEGEGK